MNTNSKLPLPPVFNRLAWSNFAAQSAEQIGLAAAPIVAVLSLRAGEGATGIPQTAQTLPFLLFSIPVGIWADRMPRARLMTRAEVLRMIALLVLLALLTLGGLSLTLLAVLGLLGAGGTVAYSVVAHVAGPSSVSRMRIGIPHVVNGRGVLVVRTHLIRMSRLLNMLLIRCDARTPSAQTFRAPRIDQRAAFMS